MSTTETDIATMQSDISHLTKAFDEFKEDTKEFHKKQSEAIDKLHSTYQEISGMLNLVSDLRTEVGLNTEWRTKNDEHLADLISEKKDNRKRLKDAAWKYGVPIIIAVSVSYFMGLQQQNSSILSALEQGIVIEEVQ